MWHCRRRPLSCSRSFWGCRGGHLEGGSTGAGKGRRPKPRGRHIGQKEGLDAGFKNPLAAPPAPGCLSRSKAFLEHLLKFTPVGQRPREGHKAEGSIIGATLLLNSLT